MLQRFENTVTESSGRVHSLNSLLKDQTFNTRYDSLSFRKLSKAGSRFFNPWAQNYNFNESDEHTKLVSPSEPATYSSFILENSKRFIHAATRSNKPLNAQDKNQNSSKNIPKSVPISLVLSKTSDNKDLESRRIVILKGFNKGSSLIGILSRVCGGPIERIVFHKNRQDSCMEIYFAFPKHAQEFFQYGQTGLLVFNSQPLFLEWANETNTEDINLVHPPVSKALLTKISNGARRSLIFVKDVPNKGYDNISHLLRINPGSFYSENFNINEVLRDFSGLGNIIDHTPIISRRLSFCIQFDDIRSAISIKNECSTKGTKLNRKYKDWYIYYGKDPADKPCLKV